MFPSPNAIRRTVLDLIYRTKSPHIGSCFSCVEILISLYFQILNISPKNPFDGNRDRFILSKGHACPSLYAVLTEAGFVTREELDGFAVDGGTLEQHPTRNLGQGIEVSTGSLGHGLSVGIGMAIAAKKDRRNSRVFVLLSDGELNEGSVWEAAMFASHHRLDNLIAIVDYNKIQALGFSEDIIGLESLSQIWSSFGWAAREVDGHDFNQITANLGEIPYAKDKPSVVVAHTVKGRGVTFMENNLLWHYRSPDIREYELALKELVG
ncbi:MAG TPA: transketolase [Syntrophorhabdaceae bacterium]|nr:transketolase [Syntrophorhabdaceae bacterium]